MPWRLIQFILIFIIMLLFVAFNLENKCDINFGFAIIEKAPVFLTVFIAFAFGILCTLPGIISLRIKNRKAGIANKPEKKQPKARNQKKAAQESEDSSFSDGGPYGVN